MPVPDRPGWWWWRGDPAWGWEAVRLYTHEWEPEPERELHVMSLDCGCYSLAKWNAMYREGVWGARIEEPEEKAKSLVVLKRQSSPMIWALLTSRLKLRSATRKKVGKELKPALAALSSMRLCLRSCASTTEPLTSQVLRK